MKLKHWRKEIKSSFKWLDGGGQCQHSTVPDDHSNKQNRGKILTSIKPIDLGHPESLPLPCISLPLLTAHFGTVMEPVLLRFCFELLSSSLRINKQTVSYWAPAIIFPSLIPPCHIICCMSLRPVQIPALEGNPTTHLRMEGMNWCCSFNTSQESTSC